MGFHPFRQLPHSRIVKTIGQSTLEVVVKEKLSFATRQEAEAGSLRALPRQQRQGRLGAEKCAWWSSLAVLSLRVGHLQAFLETILLNMSRGGAKLPPPPLAPRQPLYTPPPSVLHI